MSRFLRIVPCLRMLSACSRAHVGAPTPRREANLATPCPTIELLPIVFIGPARLQWATGVLAAYADRAARHLATVESWPAGK